jgi:hypothetical protein
MIDMFGNLDIIFFKTKVNLVKKGLHPFLWKFKIVIRLENL